MFENFIISIEAVAPMFLMILLGVFARHKGFLNDTEAKKLNKLIFNLLFPWLIFKNLYGSDIEGTFNLKLVTYGIVMLSFDFAVAIVAAVLIEKNNKSRGAMAQAIYRSNFVVMGFPIVSNIFGNENMTITAIMIAILLPISNIMAVLVLELFRSNKPNLKHAAKEIITNPLIIGALMGMATIIFKIELPSYLESPINSLYSASTPMALIVLGASINLKNIKNCRRNLIICVLGKLIILPGIVLTTAALLGFRGIEFVTLIALFAAPPPTSSYTMAEQMGSDGDLAGSCVVVASALASFTMFCWIFLFKSFGMF